jgi:hypothetical protein
MTHLHPLIVLLLLVGTSALSPQNAFGQFKGKLSDLSIPAADIGNGWTGPTGLVVDDLRDLSKHPADVQAVAKSLKDQVFPLGVVAMADFTYRKQNSPLDQVTLRVFVFDSAEKCSQWWHKKFQYEGWQQHYNRAAGDEHALDSKEVPKRVTAFSNVWLTCGSLGDQNAHIEILNRYVTRIKTNAK